MEEPNIEQCQTKPPPLPTNNQPDLTKNSQNLCSSSTSLTHTHHNRPTVSVQINGRKVPVFTIKRLPEHRVNKYVVKRTLEEAESTAPAKVSKPLPNRTPDASQPQLQTTEAPYTTTETQTEPASPNNIKEAFINPSAYNNALGCLLTERCKTILGPPKETVIFEDPQLSGSEDESHMDQDLRIIEDRSCQVCFQKPTNTSLENHRRLGGWACTHKLGMLNSEKKDALAILSLATTHPNGVLMCKFCNHFAHNIRDNSKIPRDSIYHLMSHGSLLGENPSVQDVLNKQTHGPLICLECTEVFPSFLSLMIHVGFTKDHSTKSEVFCNLCFAFFSRTTLLSHHLEHHNNTLRCPMCDLGFTAVWDLLSHLLNSKPHYTLSPDVLGLFTSQQIRAIEEQRRPNTIATTRTELLIRDTLKVHNMQHLARFLNQPELFANYRVETQEEPFGVPNMIELIAKYLNKEDSRIVSNIVRALRHRTKYPTTIQDYKHFYYEINQINIGLFLKDLWNNATITPPKLDDLLYGVDNYSGPHLLGQSYLTHSPDRITKVDVKDYRAIVIGTRLLNKAGTLPTSHFPVLNLSPDYPHQHRWPTAFFTHLGPTSVQGIVNLEGKALYHLPADRNLLQHVKEVSLKVPLHLPICVELNLHSFLLYHSPETWNNLLKTSLKDILLGFFCGLTRISQEVHQERGKHPEFLVLGQPPFSGNHQLSATTLLNLWDQVNLAATLIARFTKTLFIPATGIIGYGQHWYSNVLSKPHPTFDQHQQLSNYSRIQALQLIQYYNRARKETAEIFTS